MSNFRAKRSLRLSLFVVAVPLIVVSLAQTVHAQTPALDAARGRAVAQMVTLGVQQGISSLPPTSGQSFLYRMDPALEVLSQSTQLAPVSFRVPQPIGSGNLSLRVSESYFNLSRDFGTVDYAVTENGQTNPNYTRSGLSASARVSATNFSLNYGILDWAEVYTSVPVVVVNASATNSYPIVDGDPNAPFFNPDKDVLDESIANKSYTQGDKTYKISEHSAPFPSEQFNDGTSAGLGRVALGGKAMFLSKNWLQLAFQPEFFFGSPNSDQFAGSSSYAVLPRFVAGSDVTDRFRLHADLGYNYDFQKATLRSLVWNAGTSLAFNSWIFDFGLGGSEFDQAINWTPQRINTGNAIAVATSSTSIGSSYVDFLSGFKIQIAEHSVLSGAITLPINGQGFRPIAVGTFAFEQYF